MIGQTEAVFYTRNFWGREILFPYLFFRSTVFTIKVTELPFNGRTNEHLITPVQEEIRYKEIRFHGNLLIKMGSSLTPSIKISCSFTGASFLRQNEDRSSEEAQDNYVVAGLSCTLMDDKIMADGDFHDDGWISVSAIRLVKVRVF